MTAHDETLVRDALLRATEDLTAAAPALTALATTRGRRLRRRRRALTVAGGLGAAALVAVPVWSSLGGTTSAGVATDPTRTPSPSASATPDSGPPSGIVDNDAWATMPAADMAATFERLAPAGIGLVDVMLTNEDRAPGEPELPSPGYLLGHVTVDGTISGSVNVTLVVTGFGDDRYTCPGNLRHPDSCTEILDEDGQPVGRRSVTTSGDVVEHEVALYRENGGLVYVDATNSTDPKWGRGSAVAGPTVPLSLDQLQTIAEDEAWIGWQPPNA